MSIILKILKKLLIFIVKSDIIVRAEYKMPFMVNI